MMSTADILKAPASAPREYKEKKAPCRAHSVPHQASSGQSTSRAHPDLLVLCMRAEYGPAGPSVPECQAESGTPPSQNPRLGVRPRLRVATNLCTHRHCFIHNHTNQSMSMSARGKFLVFRPSPKQWTRPPRYWLPPPVAFTRSTYMLSASPSTPPVIVPAELSCAVA